MLIESLVQRWSELWVHQPSVHIHFARVAGGGLFNPRAKIPLRVVCHSTEPVNESYFELAIRRAVALRRELFKLDETRAELSAAPDQLDTMDALRVIQTAEVAIALVHDEYGHLEGIVTPADLLDAIVGNFVAHGDEGDAPMIVEREDGSLLIAGALPADALATLAESAQTLTLASGEALYHHAKFVNVLRQGPSASVQRQPDAAAAEGGAEEAGRWPAAAAPELALEMMACREEGAAAAGKGPGMGMCLGRKKPE